MDVEYLWLNWEVSICVDKFEWENWCDKSSYNITRKRWKSKTKEDQNGQLAYQKRRWFSKR